MANICIRSIWTLALLISMLLNCLAKDFYVSQSGTGTGQNSTNTLSSGWFSTASSWGGGSNQIAAGDTLHLVGTFSGQLNVLGSGIPGNPITVLFEKDANMTMVASGGIYLANNNYIVVDGGENGLIQNTDNGSLLGHQANVSGVVGFPTIGNITVKNLTMSNLFIHSPAVTADVDYGAGVFLAGSPNNVDVHGCRIYHNCRGILISFTTGVTSNANIYSNSVYYTGWGIAFGGGNLGSVFNGINISNNYINGQSEWDSSDNYYHEDGIYCFVESPGSYITNLVISGNVVGPDVGTHSTAAIFLSSQTGSGVWNPLVFNNVLYSQQVYANEGLFYCSRGIYNLLLCNNTLDAGVSGSIGFNFESCSNLTLLNNIYSDGSAAVHVVSTDQQTTPSQLLQCDYNDYYNLYGGSAGWGGNGGGTWINWHSWGLDLHSGLINPYYVGVLTGNFHLMKSNNIGTNLTSYGIPALSFDKDGNRRPLTGSWDVGAYQFSPTIPNPPKNVRVIGR